MSRFIYGEYWEDTLRFKMSLDKNYHVFLLSKMDEDDKDKYKMTFLTDKQLNQTNQIEVSNYIMKNYYPFGFEKFSLEYKGFKEGITEKIAAIEKTQEVNKIKEDEILEEFLKPESRGLRNWLNKQFKKP